MEKVIKGFEKYSVNIYGLVTNIATGKVLKSAIHNGYSMVYLYHSSNKMYAKRLHRLIAEAFIPNPENKLCVNHINGIKTDNRLENLEWATHSENNKHAYAIGLKSISELGRVICGNNLRNGHNAQKKLVLNTETGIFYESITEAAMYSVNCASYLSVRLNNLVENKTSFVFV